MPDSHGTFWRNHRFSKYEKLSIALDGIICKPDPDPDPDPQKTGL